MAKIWQKNVLSPFKDFQNCSRGRKDTSGKANFERDHIVPHSYHIVMKVGGKVLVAQWKHAGFWTQRLWVQIQQ